MRAAALTRCPRRCNRLGAVVRECRSTSPTPVPTDRASSRVTGPRAEGDAEGQRGPSIGGGRGHREGARGAEGTDDAAAKARGLRFDVSRSSAGVASSVQSAFHFPPQAQYRTGTCWSSTTRFLESGLRRTGPKVALEITRCAGSTSKMRRFVRAQRLADRRRLRIDAFCRLLPETAWCRPGRTGGARRRRPARPLAPGRGCRTWGRG